MIKLRYQQPSLWTGILKEDLDPLWEPWMRVADELLEDEALVDQVYEAQGRRHPQSRSRGREQTPAEVALRMLLLKHVRNWSYEVLEREVKANLVYRSFCRIGMEKVPDAKTLGKIGLALGPDVIAEMHARLVKLAQEKGVVRGRKMRTDTTVVETNIHYPTDSRLLQDGARVLTRGMKNIESKLGGLKKKVRNRMRSVTKRVIAIAYAGRQKGEEGEKKRKQQYRELLRLTRQILNDTKRVLNEVEGAGRSRRAKVKAVEQQLQTMAERLRQVVKQTKGRIFGGMTQLPDKLLSLFEWYTEIIRKGKAGKPNEFGKLVQIQEAENQIVTHYDVFAERPSDRHLLVGAVEAHQKRLGRVPELAAADPGYYSQEQEKAVQAMGVQHVSVPNRSTRSEQRRQLEKAPLVQERSALARRVGGSHQHFEEETWVESMSLPRLGRFPTLGGLGRHGRQSHSNGSMFGLENYIRYRGEERVGLGRRVRREKDWRWTGLSPGYSGPEQQAQESILSLRPMFQ